MFNSKKNKSPPVEEVIDFKVKAVKSYILVLHADSSKPIYQYKYIILTENNIVYHILSNNTLAVLEFSEGAMLKLIYEKEDGFFTEKKNIVSIYNADINHTSKGIKTYLELIQKPS